MFPITLRRLASASLVTAFAVTALAVPVMASPPEFKNGADVQKKELFVANGSSDAVSGTPTGGVVTLVTPSGAQVLNVNGSVRDLAPSTTYDVWVRDLESYSGESLQIYAPLGYFKLGTFTTDALGAGSFHLGFKTDVLADGTYDIQVAINGDDGTQYGRTVQATVNHIAVVID